MKDSRYQGENGGNNALKKNGIAAKYIWKSSMDGRFAVVAILFLVLLLSGCADSGGNTALKPDNTTAGIAGTEETAATKVSADLASGYTIIDGGQLYWKCEKMIWSGNIENDGRLSYVSLVTTAEDDVNMLAISGQTLYYTTYNGLYEMELHMLPTETRQLLDAVNITDFHITDVGIYYIDDGSLFMADLDGGNSRELFTSVTDFSILNNIIYYVASDSMLLSADLDGGNRKVLADVPHIGRLTVYDGILYLVGDNLYTYDTSKGEMAQVPLAHKLRERGSVFVCNDYILYECANDNCGQYFFADGSEVSLKYAFFADKPYMVQSDDFIYYTFGEGTLTITNISSLDYDIIKKEEYCGSSGSSAASPDTSSSSVLEPAASSGDYDIASNLQVRLTDGFGLVQSDYFSLVTAYDDLAGGLWEIIPNNESSISFYYSKAKASGNGGLVFSLMAFDWGDNSYSDFPSYNIAGLSNEKKYIIYYPTDLQYDGSNSVQVSEYRRLQEYASHINDEDSKNPFSAGP